MPETTHPRHRGPRLQRDPDHDTHPQQPADTYAPEDLPAQVDLRPHCPPIVDQGQTESCTANALAGAYGYLEGRIAGKEIPVSRLFIYYNERDIEGAVAKDEGAVISDGVKVLKKYGACEESTWPFDPNRVKEKPHDEAYEAGKGHEIDQAATVAVDLHAMKHCLAEGYPFVFGLLIDDFKPDAKGFLKRPTSTKGLGGHAMCCVGYIDAKKVFIIRNSWGTSWGDKGYGYVPYDWLTDKEACHDCWTIRRAHDLDFSEVGKDDEGAAEGDEEEDEDAEEEEGDEEEGDEEEGEEEDDEEGDEEEDDADEEDGDDDAEDGEEEKK